MFSFRISSLLIVMSLLLWTGTASFCHAQDDSTEDDFKAGPSPGQVLFSSTCAGCHGLDGRGSEKGPNIAGSARLQHLPDDRIAGIISTGVPGTGMPAFRSLTPKQVTALVAHLRVLQGKMAGRALPGDAERGKKIFSGKGQCSTCHTVSGVGGFIGPDLSAYGSALPAEAILKAILNPVRISPPGYKSAAVTMADGTRLEGVVRNEDNFSVQLQLTDGSFHFFQKSDVRSLEYLDHSLMPANYKEQLSANELNDLASYLMSAAPAKNTPASKH